MPTPEITPPHSPLRKIIVISTVTTVLAILLAGSFNYYHSLQTNFEEEKKHLLEVSHRVKNQVDTTLYRMVDDLKFVASLPQFSDLAYTDQIEGNNPPGLPENLEEDKRVILNNLIDHTSLSKVFILLPDGGYYLIHPTTPLNYLKKDNQYLTSRPFFREINRTNKPVTSNILVGTDNKAAIVFMVPLFNGNNKILGYLGGLCKLQDLSEIIKEAGLKEFMQAFVVDRRGNLIAHGQEEITPALQVRFREEPLILRFLNYYGRSEIIGPKFDCRAFKHPGENEQTMLTSICHLDNGWGLIMSRSKERVLSRFLPTIRRTTLFIGLLFLIVNTVGIFFVRSVGLNWRNTQRALRESQQRFKELVDLLPVMVCELDMEGFITYANRAALEQTNYKEEDIGKRYHILQLFVPEDRQRAKNNIARIIAGGESFANDYYMMDRMGNPFPVLVYSRPIRHDSEIVGLRGVAVPISDLKNTEKLLRQSEERFRLLYNNAPIPQQSLDINGFILEINEAWLSNLGYTYQEVIGRHLSDFMTPESKERFMERFPSVRKKGRCDGVEYTLVRKDKSQILAKFDGRVSYDESGKFLKTLCTFRDVTEERKIQLEKERYQNGLEKLDHWVRELLSIGPHMELFYSKVCEGLLDIMESESALMTLVDQSGKNCTYVGAAGKNSGYLKNQTYLLEESILCSYISSSQESIQIADLNQNTLVDREILEKLGATNGLVSPMRYDGEIVGGLSAFRREKSFDNVDQNLLNLFTHRVEILLANHNLLLCLEDMVEERGRDLEVTHKQLLQAEKLSAIGSLSASIAHEFNNPLQGIMSTIKGIKRRVRLEEEDAELVDMSINECERLKNLINSLQEFNRPTSGKQKLIDIHATIDHVLLLCKKDHQNRGIKTETNYDQNVSKVMAVEDQVKQVFLNLIKNAAESCSEGDKITITTKTEDKYIAIFFEDTGAGINPEDIEHVFEPFFTTKPEIKGTGLGLAISYGIIKAHQGEIEVESEPGKGSIFTVRLPRKENG